MAAKSAVMAASFSGLPAAASLWASSCFSSGHFAKYAACRCLRISALLGRCIIFNCYFPLPFYVWPGFYFYGICSRYGRVIFKLTVCYLIFRAVTFHFAGRGQSGYNVAGYRYPLHFRTWDWMDCPRVDIVFVRVERPGDPIGVFYVWPEGRFAAGYGASYFSSRRVIICRLGHFYHLFIWSMDTEWDLR